MRGTQILSLTEKLAILTLVLIFDHIVLNSVHSFKEKLKNHNVLCGETARKRPMWRL